MTSDEKRFIQESIRIARAETRLRHRANVTSILNLFPEILMKSHFPYEMLL